MTVLKYMVRRRKLSLHPSPLLLLDIKSRKQQRKRRSRCLLKLRRMTNPSLFLMVPLVRDVAVVLFTKTMLLPVVMVPRHNASITLVHLSFTKAQRDGAAVLAKYLISMSF
jgi:hypothetical protein